MSIVNLRRLVQFSFFLLFIVLFLRTTLVGENETEPWATLFFDIDPLVLISTYIASGSILRRMLLALIIIGLTVIVGRFFCSWMCPLGTVFNFISACRRGPLVRLVRTGTWSPWQKAKYLLLIGLLVVALCGLHAVGIFDPLPLLYRTLATCIYPAFDWGAEQLFTWLYNRDPGVGPFRVTVVSEPIYSFLRAHVLTPEPAVYDGGVLIGVLFVVLAVLALVRFKFWCRYICPLGALLGLCAKVSRLEVHNNPDLCTHCNLCIPYCHGACDPHLPGDWKKQECLVCFNCREQCPEGAISFRWRWFRRSWEIIPPRPPRKEKKAVCNVTAQKPKPRSKTKLSRRSILAAAGSGVAATALLEVSPVVQGKTYDPELIRPPGSLPEEEFLTKCIRCGECMKVCPTNAIHPTTFQAGLAGIWSPVIIPRIGYCEYNCTLCGQVCPTGAIQELAIEEKQKVHIGTAYVDQSRCLPFAYGTECIVCEEHCPTPKKAIWLEEVKVRDRDGNDKILRQPHVDAELCTGCGICEEKCPVNDRAAIVVTSAGETRNPDNQFLLGTSPYG